MYWAYKKVDGHIVVQNYIGVHQIKDAYNHYDTAKVIMPFEAKDIDVASVQVGNKLERGRFVLMETLENGIEIPRRYF